MRIGTTNQEQDDKNATQNITKTIKVPHVQKCDGQIICNHSGKKIKNKTRINDGYEDNKLRPNKNVWTNLEKGHTRRKM